jgi:hypothetical protein
MQLDYGVILATDSRFSLLNGDYEDAGRKLYPLSPDAAMVYAGDVVAAQRAVSDITEYLQRRQRSAIGDPNNVSAWYLRQAWERERGWRRKHSLKVEPLHALIGGCTPIGETWMVQISSRSNFKPIYLHGIHAVGYPQDIANFRAALQKIEAERPIEGTVPYDATLSQPDILAAMQAALTSPDRSDSVGGRIQSAVIKRNGTTFQEIHAVSAPITPDGPPVVEQMTIAL